MSGTKFTLSPKTFLSVEGRISRLQFFVGGLVASAVFIVILMIFASMMESFEGIAYSLLGTILYAIVALSFYYVLICLYSKRLHDLGATAFLCILPLFDLPIDVAVTIASDVMELPEAIIKANKLSGTIGNIFAIGFGLVLTFKSGNRGPNKYGPDPLRPPPSNTEVF